MAEAQEIRVRSPGEEPPLKTPRLCLEPAQNATDAAVDEQTSSQDEDGAPILDLLGRRFRERSEAWALKEDPEFGDWIVRLHEIMTRDIEGAGYAAWNWAALYAAEDSTHIAGLSQSEKQSIISSMEGYCVQDLDWDTLMDCLPRKIREFCSETFVAIMVTKDLYERCIKNPFWYFEPNPTVDSETDYPTSFGKDLYNLYQAFLKVNPIYGIRWKNETVRLANSITPQQAPNRAFGKLMRSRQMDAVEPLVSSMLARKPLQLLLRKLQSPKEVESRRERLTILYERVVSKMLFHWYQKETFTFKTLEDLPTFNRDWAENTAIPKRDRDGQNMHAHPEHDVRLEDSKLDGRRVLLVTQPQTICHCKHLAPDYELLISPAEVVVEDNSEEEQEQ